MISEHNPQSLEDSIKACDLHKLFEAILLNAQYRKVTEHFYIKGSEKKSACQKENE